MSAWIDGVGNPYRIYHSSEEETGPSGPAPSPDLAGRNMEKEFTDNFVMAVESLTSDFLMTYWGSRDSWEFTPPLKMASVERLNMLQLDIKDDLRWVRDRIEDGAVFFVMSQGSDGRWSVSRSVPIKDLLDLHSIMIDTGLFPKEGKWTSIAILS